MFRILVSDSKWHIQNVPLTFYSPRKCVGRIWRLTSSVLPICLPLWYFTILSSEVSPKVYRRRTNTLFYPKRVWWPNQLWMTTLLLIHLLLNNLRTCLLPYWSILWTFCFVLLSLTLILFYSFIKTFLLRYIEFIRLSWPEVSGFDLIVLFPVRNIPPVFFTSRMYSQV